MKERTSSVRASWDGHRFHVAWTARCALSLVDPSSDLVAIAVEGLSPYDDTGSDEIADVALYFGNRPKFSECRRCEILQFKYSHADQKKSFSGSYAYPTIEKFAKKFLDFERLDAEGVASGRLVFRFTTNRPISAGLAGALSQIKRSDSLDALKGQAKRLVDASGLDSARAMEFFKLLQFEDRGGLIDELQGESRRRIADWSAGGDPSARFGALKELIIKKAGTDGARNNLIRQKDVFASLDVNHWTDLLPAPPQLDPVSHFVDRPALLSRVEACVEELSRPLLVYADGGVGKTVFLQQLTDHLSARHEVVLFDCFAKGAYRSAEDHRHLAENGILQIVNTLAFRSLCDPILMGNVNASALIRTARRRFECIANSFAAERSGRRLIIIMDAADNAATFADERGEDPFSRLLLESLASQPIPGVSLVASCREHRRRETIGYAEVEQIQIEPFDRLMSDEYLRSRLPNAPDLELAAAFARSEGNPRVLSYLADTWGEVTNRGDEVVSVEELIHERIMAGIRDMSLRGARDEEITAFLAGLALLPPPIPIADFAAAIGLERGAVRSFATDLAPLLAVTPEGLVFRDEPTESVLRETYGIDSPAATDMLERLLARQSSSVYCAYAVPYLLVSLNRSDTAVSLALDGVLPSELSSEIGKRHLRTRRLTCALHLASKAGDQHALISILIEMGLLAGLNARGDAYLGSNPDLVASIGDQDGQRRLFEDRSGWRGARASRLALYFCIKNNLDEAAFHIGDLHEWIQWHYFGEEDDSKRRGGPKAKDAAIIALYLCLTGRASHAIEELLRWRPGFSYVIASELLSLITRAAGAQSSALLGELAEAACLSQRLPAGLIVALYDALPPDGRIRKRLGRYVPLALAVFIDDDPDEVQIGKTADSLSQGLLEAAMKAMQVGERKQARAFFEARKAPDVRAHAYHSAYGTVDLFGIMKGGLIRAWLARRECRPADFLPSEFRKLRGVSSLTKHDEITAFLKARETQARLKKRKGRKPGRQILADYEIEAVSTITMLLSRYADILSPWLNDPGSNHDQALQETLELWTAYRERTWREHSVQHLEVLRYQLGKACTFFLMQNAPKVETQHADAFLSTLIKLDVSVVDWISAADILSRETSWLPFAGRAAQKASMLIPSTEFIDDRGRHFAELASIFMHVDPASARAYFMRGLDELDGVGTGDFDTLYGILHIAAAQNAGAFDPVLAERLFDFCEVNFVEEPHKFGWDLFARSAERSSGLLAISRALRWHDTEKVDFRYLNGVLAKHYVANEALSAEFAAILFELDNPVGYHGSHSGDVFKEIIEKSSPDFRPVIARRMIDTIRRETSDTAAAYLLTSLEETLASVPELATCMAGERSMLSSMALAAEKRTDEDNERRNGPSGVQLSARRQREIDVEKAERKTRYDAIAENVVIGSPESLDRAIANLRQTEKYGRPELELLLLLKQQTAYKQRAQHVQSILNCSGLSASDRIEALLECATDWCEESAFVAAERMIWAKQLLSEHAKGVFDRDHGAGYLLGRIAELADCELSALLGDAIAAIAKQSIELAEDDALMLASVLTQKSDGRAAKASLERFLASLPESPSAADLGFPASISEFQSDSMWLATLIWHRLGDHDSVARWRAARAIHGLCCYQQSDAIAALGALFQEEETSPFDVVDITFHKYNARQWFLIGCLGAAREFPEMIEPLRQLFERVIKDDTNHALYQVFAARILIVLESTKTEPSEQRIAELSAVGESPFPAVERTPDHFIVEEDGDYEFRFEYEFSKHEPSLLGQVFGLHATTIERLIMEEVKRLDPGLKRMSHRAGRGSPYYHRRYDLTDRFEVYGEHIVRHAMLNVASTLLRTTPLLQPGANEESRWTYWFKQFDLTWNDGFFLADATDYPPEAAHERGLASKGRRVFPLPNPEAYFALHNLGNGFAPETVSVHTSWRSRDECSVQLVSALHPDRGAITACKALAAKPFHDRWLPEYDPDYEWMGARSPFQPFVEIPSRNIGIDTWDPHASRSAAQRPRLAPHIRAASNLTAEQREESVWCDPKGQIISQALAWGGKYGPLGQERDEQSSWLSCDRNWLLDYLKRENVKLAMLVMVDRYVPGGRGLRASSIRSAAIGLMDQTGSIRYWRVKPEIQNLDDIN